MSKALGHGWFVAGGITVIAVVAVLAWLHWTTKEKPFSLVLISIDTLRADIVGCYGSDLDATPNLDAFSKESVVFRNAYSQSPWTLPSYATLFTSTYPTEHGAGGKYTEEKFFPIKKGLKPAALCFKEYGYKTAAIVNNIFLKGEFGFKSGFDVYNFFNSDVKNIRRANEVTALGIRWLNRHEPGRDPSFLFLHYFDPHFSYNPPPEFQKKYGGKLTKRLMKINHPDEVRTGKILLNEWDKENLRNLYCGEVAYTDQEVGKLFSHLQTQGLLEKSVVVITSDHGEEFWEHNDFEHGHTQYEELVKIPLIVRFPNQAFAGMKVEQPVRLMDLMPTLFEYLKLTPPASFKGKSYLDVLRNKTTDRKVALFFEECLYGAEKKAIRSENLKLIMNTASGEVELFDLERDPDEKENIAPLKADQASMLKKTLLEVTENLKKAASSRTPSVNLSPEMMKQLRELGYTK